MSLFSTACESALRLLTFVHARSDVQQKLSVAQIAQGTDTPVAYAAKILQILSRKGLMSSVRGPHGGFYLDKHQAERLTAYDVVVAIDGNDIFKTCLLGLKACSALHPCPMHDEFMQIRSRLEVALRQIQLKALAARFNSGMFFVSLAEIDKTHLK